MSTWTLSDVLGYISICCWLGAQFPSVKSFDCVKLHGVCLTLTDDTSRLRRQSGHRKCAQKVSRGPFSPIFGQLVPGYVPLESVWVGRGLNRGLERRRLYESSRVYSYTSATVSSEMPLPTQPPYTKLHTTSLRRILRHISSLSTSAYWVNITTTGNPPHQLHRIFERAPRHSAEGWLKTEATTEASPLQLRTSPPLQRSWLPIKRSKALVHFTDFLEGALMRA